MADIADLERRVTALEAAQVDNTKTLNWVVGTLGRVSADVSAVKDDVRALTGKVDKVEGDIVGLRRDLPGIVGDAVRDAMKNP
jgi:hypothetical protein